MTAMRTSGAMYFEAVTIRRDYTAATGAITTTVTLAPDITAISPELYKRACAGDCEGLDAGEGLFAIYADNGTFRYRLTGDFESYSGALMAEKISGPEVKP